MPKIAPSGDGDLRLCADNAIGAIVGGASTAMVWSRLGPRRAYTLGAGVFAGGTLCCALAPNTLRVLRGRAQRPVAHSRRH
jgi:MFS family permease